MHGFDAYTAVLLRRGRRSSRTSGRVAVEVMTSLTGRGALAIPGARTTTKEEA